MKCVLSLFGHSCKSMRWLGTQLCCVEEDLRAFEMFVKARRDLNHFENQHWYHSGVAKDGQSISAFLRCQRCESPSPPGCAELRVCGGKASPATVLTTWIHQVRCCSSYELVSICVNTFCKGWWNCWHRRYLCVNEGKTMENTDCRVLWNYTFQTWPGPRA